MSATFADTASTALLAATTFRLAVFKNVTTHTTAAEHAYALVEASGALFWAAAEILGSGIDAQHEVDALNVLAVGTRVSVRSGLMGGTCFWEPVNK